MLEGGGRVKPSGGVRFWVTGQKRLRNTIVMFCVYDREQVVEHRCDILRVRLAGAHVQQHGARVSCFRDPARCNLRQQTAPCPAPAQHSGVSLPPITAVILRLSFFSFSSSFSCVCVQRNVRRSDTVSRETFVHFQKSPVASYLRTQFLFPEVR